MGLKSISLKLLGDHVSFQTVSMLDVDSRGLRQKLGYEDDDSD